MYDVLDLQ